MLAYVLRRFVYMFIILFLVSIVAFIIIELPPGDYVTFYMAQLRYRGRGVAEEDMTAMRMQYGLDKPIYSRYFLWMGKVLHGDLGMSFKFDKPVRELIIERLPLTVTINIFAIILVYVVAIPIGIYSATHQYSIGDYIFTIIGFAGLAIPNFFLALALLFIFYKWFGFGAGGLFSPEYRLVPWSLGKFVNMLQHLSVAVIVEGTAGTAGLIRVMRGCLLDELGKQYVITARAKGVSERSLLFKYPVRVAINPIISTLGWMLPAVVSGGAIVEIVLSLPTMGPLIFSALMQQDMYLAAGSIMMLASLTVIGTFVSDLLLVWIDPRIRYQKRV